MRVRLTAALGRKGVTLKEETRQVMVNKQLGGQGDDDYLHMQLHLVWLHLSPHRNNEQRQNTSWTWLATTCLSHHPAVFQKNASFLFAKGHFNVNTM